MILLVVLKRFLEALNKEKNSKAKALSTKHIEQIIFYQSHNSQQPHILHKLNVGSCFQFIKTKIQCYKSRLQELFLKKSHEYIQ